MKLVMSPHAYEDDPPPFPEFHLPGRCAVKAGLLPVLSLLLAIEANLRAAVPAGKTQTLTSPDQVPEGLAKSDWPSIRAAYEAGRHAFQPDRRRLAGAQSGAAVDHEVRRARLLAEPRDGGWQWGLELKSYGFPGAERAIGGAPAVKAEGQRLTYDWDATVQEWFVNDARGLEHGFTVQRAAGANPRSATPIRNPLTFTLAVRGTLRPAGHRRCARAWSSTTPPGPPCSPTPG